MKLKFVNQFKSVNKFDEIEISNFSVFTGKNGSGKTHFLKAIKEGRVMVDDFNINQILYYDYSNFSYNFQRETSPSDATEAWSIFNSNNASLAAQLKSQENIIVQWKEVIQKTANIKNKAIFSLEESDFEEQNALEIVDIIRKYRINIEELLNKEAYVGDEVAQSIYSSIISKSKVFLSDINQHDFLTTYNKVAISGRVLISNLSNIFFRYFQNIESNKLDKINGKEYLTDNDFIEKNGLPPWDLIRGILKEFNSVFDVNDPIRDGVDPFKGVFYINFINTIKDNKKISFDDLSSGERVIITLINMIYTLRSRRILPKLILLDEVDASLNPSVIDKFISFLKNDYFLSGIYIIIATHSPTTVALSAEDSIYLIDTSRKNPISLVEASVAIKSLSEGFWSLGDILDIKHIKKSKILITEGKNSLYIEKAMDFFYKKEDLFILKKKVSGSGQIRTLFDFMIFFNQEKEFIFVWDCDYRMNEGKNRKLNELITKANLNNRAFVFEYNSTGISPLGIENLIDRSDCVDYTSDINKNKDAFRRYIFKKENLQSILKNIKPLFDFIDMKKNTNLE